MTTDKDVWNKKTDGALNEFGYVWRLDIECYNISSHI